jgi:glycosyltransferase involved in cell wall biosynthesis
VIAGHVVPGGVIARRAVGPGVAVVKVHGSDLEYAVRPDDRYRVLAREGLVDARAVVGASRDVLRRTFSFVREAEPLGRVVAPGIDERFQPMPRAEGLESAASALDDDPDASRGRPPGLDERVREALGQRDGWAIEDLGSIYDQEVPDPGAAAALRSLTGSRAPFVGYFGKLIPQKGPQLLLQAVARLGAGSSVQTIVVGFGSFREWLHALVAGLDAGDVDAVRWIASTTGIDLELTGEEIEAAAGLAGGVTFTGRLDHRYAPGTLAAVDVLVVPSVLDEAFGIVAIEGAAAGAVPVVARHSGLAEVAAALEAGVRADGTPRFSYEPGAGAVARIAAAIDGHLGLPVEDRARLREEVASFAAREWSWDHTARLLLEAGAPRSG